ncbi:MULTISPECIES: hypothetical protein [Streptomyces]|uniref:hypothetical protein n=1 Tax=Streptomyces TaxID=1883 RepID=UPI000467D7D7|nr:hypothetical protein [Streptomyces exfoliatus]
MTGPTPHRLRRALTGAALAGTLLALTGCASSVDPIERLGRKAAERMGTRDGATVAEGTARTADGSVRPARPAHPARADDLVRTGGHAD